MACIHRFKCLGNFMLFRQLSMHSVRRFTNWISVTQALKALPEREIPVIVQGWVKSVRQHKDVVFLDINDGSSFKHLQIVTKSLSLPSTATYGSCVKVVGSLVRCDKVKQPVEVQADHIEVLGQCDFKSFPFKAHKLHSLDYVRQYLHLRPRTMMFGALLRVRNAATMAMHKYFQNEGFCMVHTPILTSNDCEGAGEVFQVEPADKKILQNLERDTGEGILEHFFGVPTFLTVSGQLHLEIVTGAFSKVYTFGPTFRAENSRTRHHLSEFSMIEAEIAFTQSLDDIMKVIEGLLRFATQEILSSCPADVAFIRQRVMEDNQKDEKVAVAENQFSKPFVKLTYTDAINVLLKHNDKFQNKASWGIDLFKEHERFLVEHCGAGVPVFVTDYPESIKPFYARRNSDGQTVAAVDLLASGVGEICGGSLREERLSQLEQKLNETALKGNLDWYLDLRRFGSAPHGGFGIGFERYLQTLLGIQNIRDMLPFPRTANSCRL